MKELNPEVISNEVIKSWKRCSQNGVSLENVSYQKYLNDQDEIVIRNRKLTEAFLRSVNNIIDYISGQYLFILTDFQGYLLDYVCDHNIEDELLENNIIKGTSFLEDSLGTNAISLSITLKKPIYLMAEQHYCDFFKKWCCFSVPLKYRKKIIGYLDISSIEVKLRNELRAILYLLADNIVNKLDNEASIHNFDKREYLSLKQLKVLKLLTSGMTEQEVADKLKVTVNTIKYHKRKIYMILEARSLCEALIKAVKRDILVIEEL